MKTVQPASPGQGNLVPVTGTYVLTHQDLLQSRGIPIYRVLRDPSGALRADPVPPSSAAALGPEDRERKQFLIDKDWQKAIFAAEDPYGRRLQEWEAETPEARTEAVSHLKTTLADLKSQRAEPLVKAQAIMDTVSKTFLANKASLKLKPMDVSVHEKTLAKDTSAIVGTALEMAEDPELVSGLFAAFQGLSNGQTVNHVVRVFASYSGFLRFYNALHQQRLPQLLRRIFPQVYLPAYRRLLPRVPDHLMTSDQVLQLPLLEPHDLREYALGAFLHDIGKMGNIDYFESDLAYDPQQIQQHVFLSAGLILMNYGNEHEGARLLAGDHHNALGHPKGYGVTREETARSHRARVEAVRCLSGQPEGFVSGEALGWLPVEMLAVADVYDAMIDDSRAYKKPLSPAEAAVFLEDTMAAEGRLDPVLVDLYIDFLRTQKKDLPADRGFAYKAGRRTGVSAG